jgi:hypothetical protein
MRERAMSEKTSLPDLPDLCAETFGYFWQLGVGHVPHWPVFHESSPL